MVTGERAEQAPRTFWERALPGWHAACYGLLAVLLALLLVEDLTPGRRAAALALAAGYGLAYTFLGRRVLGRDDDRRGTIYLIMVLVLMGLLLWLTPSAFLLLFIVVPQIWASVSTRLAVMMVVVLVLGITVAILARGGWTREAATEATITGAVNLAVALLLGLWISGLARESDKRAALIEELRATRTELAAAHHQQGILAERARLASEIHDTLAQGFTSLLMLVRAAEAALETDPDAARERLRLAEQTAGENLAEARALVSELGPLDLQAASLPEAVGRLTDRIGVELGIPADVTVTGRPRPLPSTTEVVLLRATQEALANVRKHARATTLAVRLDYGDAGTTLEVIDDGRGFEPARVDGFGLRGMRSRVEHVGGLLELSSTAGCGTTLRVSVP